MIKYGLPSFGLIALILAIISIAKPSPSSRAFRRRLHRR